MPERSNCDSNIDDFNMNICMPIDFRFSNLFDEVLIGTSERQGGEWIQPLRSVQADIRIYTKVQL